MPLIKDPKTGNMVQVDSRIYINEEGTMVVEGTRTPSGKHSHYHKIKTKKEVVMRNSEDGQLLEDRKNPGNGRFNPAAYHWKQSQRYEKREFKRSKKEKEKEVSSLELVVNLIPTPKTPKNNEYNPLQQPYTPLEHQIA